ncbi:MAG: hypothetical protein NVSMB18_28390 [Acetobacteraceae bacterium]
MLPESTGASALRRLGVLLPALLAVGVIVAAAVSQSDANWDMRNYHLYNPFAFLHKAPGVDIAPAHMQSYFAPTMDFYFYVLVRHVTSTPILNALAAIPHALALALVFALTSRLMTARSPAEQLLAFVAVVIGATGAAGGSTLATTMDESLPACLFVLALLALVGRGGELPSSGRVLLAGLLAGAACGLKLTFSYASIALAVAMFAIPRRHWRELITRPALLGVGGVAGALLLSGYWWAIQWSRFGNPLFPLMNDIFHAPLGPDWSFVDDTYLPRTWDEAIRAPWAWALHLYTRGGESRLRDPRFAIGVVAALTCLLQSWLMPRLDSAPRRRWPVVFVALWFLLGFALWRRQFSIFRYLAVLELFTGPLLALAVLPWARRLGAVRPAVAGMAALLVPLVLITVYPNLARAPRGTRPYQVDMGPVAPDAMVLLLDTSPMAYLALSVDPRVRFVATNDYFMSLGDWNRMQPLVGAAIAAHPGELWGVDTPLEQVGAGDRALAFYRLVRGACHDVVSNLSPNPVRMCRLSRQDGTKIGGNGL